MERNKLTPMSIDLTAENPGATYDTSVQIEEQMNMPKGQINDFDRMVSLLNEWFDKHDNELEFFGV